MSRVDLWAAAYFVSLFKQYAFVLWIGVPDSHYHCRNDSSKAFAFHVSSESLCRGWGRGRIGGGGIVNLMLVNPGFSLRVGVHL